MARRSGTQFADQIGWQAESTWIQRSWIHHRRVSPTGRCHFRSNRDPAMSAADRCQLNGHAAAKKYRKYITKNISHVCQASLWYCKSAQKCGNIPILIFFLWGSGITVEISLREFQIVFNGKTRWLLLGSDDFTVYPHQSKIYNSGGCFWMSSLESILRQAYLL